MTKKLKPSIIALLLALLHVQTVMAETPFEAECRSGRIFIEQKTNTSLVVIIDKNCDKMIDNLLRVVSESGGSIDESSNLGSTTTFNTTWFDAGSSVWAYDLRLGFMAKPVGEERCKVAVTGELRAQIDGSRVLTQNKIIRKRIRSILAEAMIDGL